MALKPLAGAHRPRKRFGQHFLQPAWIDKVIHLIEPGPDDVFLEIGPGHGELTHPLAALAKHVIACEVDRDLAESLRAGAPPNVAVVEGDILEAGWRRVTRPPGRFRVVGNLPYNVASPILFSLSEIHASGTRFADATLMLQREVATRLTAEPGSRDYGVLTVLIRHRAAVDQLLRLPPGAFRPPPEVHSSLVRLRFHDPEPVPKNMALFTALVRAVFTRRRKTMANALRAYPPAAAVSHQVLESAGIEPMRRPETLTIAELVAVADVLAGPVL